MVDRVRFSCRAGFGLPATILTLIVFALLGLVGLSMARQELRSQVRVTSREAAFYAAEVGLARGLQNWSTPTGLYPPGTTWELHSGTLSGQASYRVSARMLDDRSVHTLFSVRSEGRSRDGHIQEVGLLVTTLLLDNPIRAAMEVLDTVYLAGTADIEGMDHIPSEWNGPYCEALSPSESGILMSDTTLLEVKGGAAYDGDPPLDVLADTTGFFDFGDITYDELAATADVQLAGGAWLGDDEAVQPSYLVDGSCNTADPVNWGDPENPGQPCSNWFPIIHVKGNLKLEGNYAGQGIILVDGDLSAKGGFHFYGPVLVKGTLHSAGNFIFYGGVRAGKTKMSVGTSQIYYSDCVLERVLSHTSASRPRPVTERPWFQER